MGDPLTPTQTGMLFHRLLDRHSGVDVQQLVIDGPPDREWFLDLVAKHAVLRTSFRWEGLPEPVQEVAPHVELPWTEQSGDLDAYLREDRARGFELDRAPLMRFAHFAREGKLVWTYHQSLLDGRSLALLFNGGASGAPFREYAHWLRQQPHNELFWREHLRGFTAPTPLPVSHEIGEGYGELVLDPHPHVIAAWALLLSRYSGEEDVVIGVAKSRRPPGFENSIGMFINTLPLRVRVAPDTPASTWLREVELQQQELVAHEHTPLVHIQKWSDVPAGAQLFESLVIIEDTAPPHRLHERTSYPLTLTASPESIRITYDRRRIDDATARRVAGHLETLLAHLHEERPLSTLPILTGRERQQLLVDWNATARDFPVEQCIHHLFEAQAAKTPDRVAVSFEGRTVTYRELNARAEEIARQLRALGVGPDVFVGILVERSPDMVAALLGILKAGGAYVPLDPMYPVDRLEYMLEDSKAPVLITQQSLAGLVKAPGAATLLLDGAPASSPAGPGASRSRHDNLAYVIYTSGSTGKPKGVQIPHRAAVNFLHSMAEAPGLAEDDVLLAVTTLSFDIAGLELYLPLITGARLELASRETAADGRRLAEELQRTGATVMQATPATWRMLLEAGWEGDRQLKILCGGEALSGDLAERLLARCGSLWNMYGPTETTIWSTVNRVERGDGTTISIGRPIANTDVYLLDRNLQPVPIGVAGELHIGGIGLARGYLNRPELTAEKFIPDPFRGGRMYKTGDAARYLPDGRIEYLNRLDNQVKLRGYRIELGEIEAALRKHPGINEAVVVVRSDTGAKALAAYFIPNEPAPNVPELREFLKESLPEYMVPSFFVPLDAFPLTPNGKVDRKVLPAPDRSIREDEDSFVPPRDELETRLATIWSDVLGAPRVGIRDNFFELGGESILALRMFVQIEQQFGRKLPLATLIQANTIEALANALRGENFSAPWSPLVAIQPRGTRRPFFCVHGVGGNVINYRGLAAHLGNDQPFYALQARGLDGAQTPITKIEEMARVYVEEIRRVQPEGPYLLGGLSFGGVVAYEMAQQLLEAGQETHLIALFDTAPVGYSALTAKAASSGTFVSRMKVHLGVLLHGPDRALYLFKRVRRVWRKVVYKTWQTTFAVFAKLRRPLPAALQDVQQANYMALRDYRARVYPGQVTFFYAEREPEGFTREKQHGWSILAAGGVNSEVVPGDHLTMLDEPHVGGLAVKLAACIAEAASRVPIGSAEDKKHRTDEAQPGPYEVQVERLPHVEHRKRHEHAERDHLLQDLELRE